MHWGIGARGERGNMADLPHAHTHTYTHTCPPAHTHTHARTHRRPRLRPHTHAAAAVSPSQEAESERDSFGVSITDILLHCMISCNTTASMHRQLTHIHSCLNQTHTHTVIQSVNPMLQRPNSITTQRGETKQRRETGREPPEGYLLREE